MQRRTTPLATVAQPVTTGDGRRRVTAHNPEREPIVTGTSEPNETVDGDASTADPWRIERRRHRHRRVPKRVRHRA